MNSADAFKALEAGESDATLVYVGMDDSDEGMSNWRLIPVEPFELRADRMAQADGHAVAWGYNGEGEFGFGGVYGWDCTCGEVSGDYMSDDEAAMGASAHLAEIEPVKVEV